MSGPGESSFDEEQRILEALVQAAAALTGFSREAILPDAMRRSSRELLAMWTPQELLARIERNDPQVQQSLRLAVSVGETFFYRQPEHFQFIQEVLVPSWLARNVRQVRAWSAGCATGEEPFSVAAFLQDKLSSRQELRIDVLGTDLLTRNLAVARSATYGAWSQRPSAPLLAPLLRPLEGPAGAPPLVRVLDTVRFAVRFLEHNLLSPSPEEQPFDLIFCRNVLVYFAPDAARRAIANLSAALAPGGVLMLGSMDLNVAAPDLQREGKPESLIFRKREAQAQAVKAPRPIPTTPPQAPTASPSSSGAKKPGSSGGAKKPPSNPDLRPMPPLPARVSGPGIDRPLPSSYVTTPASNPRVSAMAPGLPSAPPAMGRVSGPGEKKPPGSADHSATIPEPMSLHLRALLQIESGELDAAERTLRTLLASLPDYLPGMFERALLHLRRGEPAAATALMREVHRRASALPPDSSVAGPEPLDARFYVESAEAYLRGGRG